jgi:hypothetical protein
MFKFWQKNLHRKVAASVTHVVCDTLVCIVVCGVSYCMSFRVREGEIEGGRERDRKGGRALCAEVTQCDV